MIWREKTTVRSGSMAALVISGQMEEATMQLIMRPLTAPVWRLLAVVFIFVCISPLATEAKSPEIFTGLVQGIAVGGYDPVAYFTEHKPVQGKADITYSWKGATWRFANAQNRDAFKAAPEKYAPQYGGYCAYAVAKGGTAKGDPNAWRIVDGKLYLNLSTNVQKLWEKDIPGYIKAAEKNWPNVLK
jgi:YHS domain-containing protein